MAKPLIITMGDPTGVGPEIILQAFCSGAFGDLGRPLVVAGDVAVLCRAAEACGMSLRVHPGSHLALASAELVAGDVSLPVRELSRRENRSRPLPRATNTGAAWPFTPTLRMQKGSVGLWKQMGFIQEGAVPGWYSDGKSASCRLRWCTLNSPAIRH